MWSGHTACSVEIVPSTTACISSIGDSHLLSTKGTIWKVYPGCCKICSAIEREDLPNISENTSSSLKLETVRQLCARFFSLVIIQVSLKWYLTKSLNWWISVGGIKEGLTMLHIYKSQIHLASLCSVLLLFWDFLYWGWERVTQMLFFAKILKTEIQYLPVDSIQTSVQLYFASRPHNSCNLFVKGEKRACIYSVRLWVSVIPM